MGMGSAALRRLIDAISASIDYLAEMGWKICSIPDTAVGMYYSS